MALLCVSLLLGLPAAGALLHRKGPLQSSAPARPCTDLELESFARAIALGNRGRSEKVHRPDCIPATSQGLWPLGAANQDADAGARAPLASTVASPAASAVVLARGGSEARAIAKGNETKAAPYFVHLHVVASNADWCEAPCSEPTWELQAPKASSPDSGYRLFEAAIWHQERRVALYEFDPRWVERARRAYHDICGGKGWSCLSYKLFRESRALLAVGPWPARLDGRPAELSAWLLAAFRRIFAKMAEETPGAEHVGLTYSGHGASADGALFEGAIQAKDAQALMSYVTGIGAGAMGAAAAFTQNHREEPSLELGRLSILNFGGNCAEGRWNMVFALHTFADWIVASDLNVGGLDMREADEEEQREILEAQERLGDLVILKQALEAKKAPFEALRQLVEGREKLWQSAQNRLIASQRLRQSIAVFESARRFAAFRAQLRKAYAQLPQSGRESFRKRVEGAQCDVLAATAQLDASDPTRSGDGLSEAFRTLRPLFASTQSLFQWDVETCGLGFNFLGHNEPPCDLKAALGS
eukprot:TRINITY_DN30070_c0_g1_i2.p1 TRINITY_DN30070_c0_g1~~TRINITY_DN30070_c0_g1_i2.p1  ORF type:complete len:564 (-),score=119.88 TRINITY_DN30070_c0_g1_i2:70-1662(-)